MHISKRSAAAVAAGVMIAGCTVVVLAQASDAGAGSLGELTAEIRQLRFAIEQSTRTQTQAQALGIFLSAQQTRIVQVTARLDTARRELEGIERRSAAYTRQLEQLEEVTPKTTDPNERIAREEQLRDAKLALKDIAGQEQQARARESEMLQMWQQEEARWNDLIGRLQQVVQR